MTESISRESTTTRGVLVAISILIFTAQLEKARDATDEANIRSAYAELSAKLLTWDGTSAINDIEVSAVQTQTGWQFGQPTIGGIKDIEAKTKGSIYVIHADTTSNQIIVDGKAATKER